MDRTTTTAVRLLSGALSILCNLVIVYAIASLAFMAQDGLLHR